MDHIELFTTSTGEYTHLVYHLDTMDEVDEHITKYGLKAYIAISPNGDGTALMLKHANATEELVDQVMTAYQAVKVIGKPLKIVK